MGGSDGGPALEGAPAARVARAGARVRPCPEDRCPARGGAAGNGARTRSNLTGCAAVLAVEAVLLCFPPRRSACGGVAGNRLADDALVDGGDAGTENKAAERLFFDRAIASELPLPLCLCH